MKFMKKILSLIVLISALILMSCHTTRKAQNQLKSVMKYHPELVSNVCKDSFPCVTSKIDTVTNVEYEFVEIQCPGYETAKKDTIHVTHNKIIKGPAVVVTEQKTNNITKLIKDSASIKSYELELKACNKKCNDLTAEKYKLQNKISTKNRWIMWLIIALLCSILCNVLQLKK